MRITGKQLSYFATTALFVGAAACSNKVPAPDAALVADLKAATSNPSQVVVSPLEGGPQSAPKKAAPQRVYKPTPRAETRVASTPEPVRTPEAAPPVIQQPVQQQAPQPAPVQPAAVPTSRPQPVQAQQSQHGPYKSEAEIFRQMPWIRP